MRERLVHIRVLTWATLIETVRRKDLYVVWMLAVFGLITGRVLGSMADRGAETLQRDLSLTVVNFLSIAICIWLAARQVPEELSRRTLFPLLARPVRRFDVLFSKFLAVWILASGAAAVLAGIAWLSLAMAGAAVGRDIFLQYLLLRMLSFGPIAAITIALSLVLTPPATVVLSGLLTIFGTQFARAMEAMIPEQSPPVQLALKAFYFAVPHLDLFDLSSKTAYNYPPAPLWVLPTLSLYAAAYVFIFLSLGNLKFQRMAV
jgi:ABC-type transport system involved in multi-copper enzyme maturation permease subunit